MSNKRTNVIAKNIYPIIREALDKKGAINKYKKNIQNFMNLR